MTGRGVSLDLTYVLPIKASELPGPDLTAYLRRLSQWCAVVVVDGSTGAIFEANEQAWASSVRHLSPDDDLRYVNGKVNGVITGLRRASTDKVVIGDDDVRYEQHQLARVSLLLDDAEVVVPQNFFEPLPWHAYWDTARSLLNRATGMDFPGSLGLRRSALEPSGGRYDGDVLFENLELMRTVERSGGRVLAPLDLYVARRPPTTSHFLRQRVRQAYDEFARPWRLGLWLAVGPLQALLAATGRWGWLVASIGGTMAVAEVGRRRAGGTAVFPATSVALAPLWVMERTVCSWLALGARLRGGARYGPVRIRRAASSGRRGEPVAAAAAG